MFSHLTQAPTDPIMLLMDQFQNDTRADKVDLGVGVYKDSSGITPIMAAIKAAEQNLWQVQNTKTYTKLAGSADFINAMQKLVLGDGFDPARVAGAATPGGTGAIPQYI